MFQREITKMIKDKTVEIRDKSVLQGYRTEIVNIPVVVKRDENGLIAGIELVGIDEIMTKENKILLK